MKQQPNQTSEEKEDGFERWDTDYDVPSKEEENSEED